MKKNRRIRDGFNLVRDGIADKVIPSKKPHIIIACMPKSGSTFLSRLIGELPGFSHVGLVESWDGREQEFDAARLSRYNRRPYVAQQHSKYNSHLQIFIEQYRLTPIVQVRNFADCVISLRDFYRKRKGQSAFVAFEQSHRDLPDAEFEEAIARFVMPWYVQFYVTWRTAPTAHFFDYDEVISDPVQTVKNILVAAGVTPNFRHIETALERIGSQDTNFNVGKSERGKNICPAAKKTIGRLMDFYPDLKDDPLFLKTRETIKPL